MDTITIAPKAKRSGMIMPLVATIIVFIFLIGIAMLKIGFGSRFMAARTSSEIAARSAADAGLTMAMHLMTPGISTPSPMNYTLPNARASFDYVVTDVTVAPDPIRRFRIRSTGVSDQISRTVYAMTWATSFWSYAIAVDDTITFHSKIVMDVVPEGSDFTPDIRTSSTEDGAVELFPNTEIPGDIVVGPGGDPESVVQVKSSSVINGETYAADTAIDFPDVTLPEGLPFPIAWEPNSVVELNESQSPYAYSSITLRAAGEPGGMGDKLVITGDVVMYVDGPVRLHNDTELYIEGDPSNPSANSSLSLYLGGTFIADKSGEITNATEDARNLRMYGTETCTKIEIKNSGEFWGAIYAPYADLLIHNSGATYGAFTGNSFDMRNSAEFYYDTRLYDFDPTGELSFFQVERWWER